MIDVFLDDVLSADVCPVLSCQRGHLSCDKDCAHDGVLSAGGVCPVPRAGYIVLLCVSLVDEGVDALFCLGANCYIAAVLSYHSDMRCSVRMTLSE